VDISDGLVKDLKSLCYASKCGAFLDFLSIPFSKRAIKAFNNKKINPIDIFSKGDDYQILFTAPKKHRKIIKTIAKKTYTKVTHIGEIRPKNRLKMSVNKKIFDLTSTNIGYIHTF
jgi:thiamine-monophosphate kinase